MRFLHLADLHLGKRLKEFSLIDDQRYVLSQAVSLVKDEKLDGVFLAGDIYDSSVPSTEAVSLLDDFLTALNEIGTPVFIISGNHDSAEKLQFGGRIFSKNHIYVVTDVKQSLTPIVLKGIVIYLLPFVKPIDVNYAFGTTCKTYSEAIGEVIRRMRVDVTKTNILLAHQTVLPLQGSLLIGGSETIGNVQDGAVVGDVSAIPSSLFNVFDYVALGHIHKAQAVSKNARYPGSLLKYHKDEASNEKAFTLVNVNNKAVSIETRPYHVLHDVMATKGTLEEVMAASLDPSAYLFVTLLDHSLLDNPMARLRTKYPYTAAIEYESLGGGIDLSFKDIKKKTKEELFADFYEEQNGSPMNIAQKKLIQELLGKEGN